MSTTPITPPTPTGLWIDETNAAEWAEGCHRDVAAWLSVIVGEHPGDAAFASNLKIEVRSPRKKAARQAYGLNRTLMGQISFRWFDQEEVLHVPMSFNGMFFFHRDGASRALPSVWPSWLAERNAFRIVLPTDERKRAGQELEWRLGLPDGSWVGAPLKKLTSKWTKAENKRLCRKQPVYLGQPEGPEWFTSILSQYGPGNVSETRKADDAQEEMWGLLHAQVLKRSLEKDSLAAVSDEDDLEHKMLMTFPVWLRHRISWGLLQAMLPVEKKKGRKSENLPDELAEEAETRHRISAILMGQEDGDETRAVEIKKLFRKSLRSLGAKIHWAMNNYRSNDRTDYIDPINPLDLAARVSRVRRFDQPSRFLEEKPEEFRQNHPSFEGRICPVDSPESGMVGLTLHLAAGAMVDLDGRIHPAKSDVGKLGFGAGLVPFFGHNDGARNMMGAKNLRQAIPVHGAETPAVLTGGEAAVMEFIKPLLDLGVCPKTVDTEGRLVLGRDLLVAYMPWYGMNMEDAMVVSETAAVALGCENLKKPPIRKVIPIDWELASPEPSKDFPELDEAGLIKAGTKVYPGTALACFACKGKQGEEQRIIRYKDRTPALVKRIAFHRKNEWMTGNLEIELELPIPARPGDKLMGRHGNKGVIGTILPDEQMPRLPESLGGKAIDLVLNPHGVIGRMNLGQLLETHVGWLLHNGCAVNDLTKENHDAGGSIATAFSDVIDHDKVQVALGKTGLDRYGRAKLLLPDGGETASPVVVGFQHIVRLRHIPELKSQARRGGDHALYSARTGQAIHGRKLGGGQRLGEMEIWALDGHQADAILSEMLGIKSSADLIKNGGADLTTGYSGYSRVLKDWLFAMGIDLATTEEEVKLGFPKATEILARVGKENEVTIPGGVQSRVTASFGCSHGTKNHPCKHQLLEGEKIAFKATKGQLTATLRLADVFEHLNLEPSGKLKEVGGCYRLLLQDAHTRNAVWEMEFRLTPNGDAVTGIGKFVVSSPWPSDEEVASLSSAMGQAAWTKKPQHAEWNLHGIELHLYGRFGKGTKQGGSNLSAVQIIEQFVGADPSQWQKQNKHRQDGNRQISDLTVICPRHAGKAFTGMKPFGEKFTSEPGGLLDAHIFGNYATAFRSDHRWGYIELPVAIEFPLHSFLGKFDSSLSKSKKQEKKKAAIEGLRNKLSRAGVEIPEVPDLQYIPVLPVRYRVPFRVGGRIVSNDLDLHGYIPVLEACAAYRRNPNDQSRANIEDQVARLFRKLAAALDKKDGLIRRDGLGRRVDRSARLVITPNPNLPWDEVGMPTPVLFELIGDLVQAWREKPHPTETKPRPPLPKGSWINLADTSEEFEAAKILLEAFLDANPEFVVLLNRQPSLHRDSFQAFKPRPLPSAAGDVIQLSPLVCKGFAADFDGDEMVVHVPVSEGAQVEARRMLPSVNLHSLATVAEEGENVLAHFDQDFVMGTWLLGSADPMKQRDAFLSKLPDGPIRRLASAWSAFPTKADGGKLLAEITSKEPTDAAKIIWDWFQVALKACTEAGVSFGFYELRELAEGIRSQVLVSCADRLGQIRDAYQADADYNADLDSLARNSVANTATSGNLGDSGFGFAALTYSGAKGKPEQLRQILAARGLLHPGKTGFDPSTDKGWVRFFIPHSLCGGLDFNSCFWAAMNARTSMVDKKLGTGYGGGLTRSMVFALWPCRITREDCGSDASSRSPLTCKEKQGICARCYGDLPCNRKLAPIGFPAGMLAAQSIGERGTQLSMQSFHAGKKAIDIHEARTAIKTPGKVGIATYSDFVGYLKGASAYKKILDRHFEVIWRALSQQGEQTLVGVIGSHDPLTLLAYRHNPAQLLYTVMASPGTSRTGTIARLLTGDDSKTTPNQKS